MFPIVVLCLCAAAALAGLVLVVRGIVQFPLLEDPPSTQRVEAPEDEHVNR